MLFIFLSNRQAVWHDHTRYDRKKLIFPPTLEEGFEYPSTRSEQDPSTRVPILLLVPIPSYKYKLLTIKQCVYDVNELT